MIRLRRKPRFSGQSARRPAVRKRTQRVRFRRRYAASMMRETGLRLVKAVQAFLIIGAVCGGGYLALRAWQNSSYLKITAVELNGDIPQDLEKFLNIRTGQNILEPRLARLEKESLERFPQLKDLSIRRTWDRKVTVMGSFRRAVLVTDQHGRQMGIDADGVLFPLSNDIQSAMLCPVLSGMPAKGELLSLVGALSVLETEFPDFYSRIRRLETDKMLPLQVIFDDGVSVYWEGMEPSSVLTRALNIMRLRERFIPKQPSATLRFVSDDRIVMDANWIKLN